MNVTKILISIFFCIASTTGEAAMKILCIMHADFEKPGVIEEWAQQKGYEFSICSPYKDKQWLDCKRDFDLLIIMGGPQSACAINELYLSEEIDFIKCAIDDQKKVLGICLGAQLIGKALGASAEKSPVKEVGIFPIELTSDGKKDALLADFPEQFSVMHWHNDMPGLTAQSVVLATSRGCPRQIVRYDKHVYGFQCHFEIRKNDIQAMITNCLESLESGMFTQSEYELMSQDYDKINKKMFSVLDRLAALK